MGYLFGGVRGTSKTGNFNFSSKLVKIISFALLVEVNHEETWSLDILKGVWILKPGKLVGDSDSAVSLLLWIFKIDVETSLKTI